MTLLTVLTVIFLVASATLYGMQYFDHPAIPGYILAGLIISPFVTGDALLDLAQIGILFLVFIFGLKFDPSEINTVGQSTLLVTVLQLIVTGSIGYAVGYQLGISNFEALVLGVASALSSTLVGLELAEQEIHRHLLHGRLAESMHLIQDVLGLLILSVLFTSSVSAAVTASIITVFFIIAALSIRRYVFTFIGSYIQYNTEILMLIGFSSLILSTYAAIAFDLPLIIGAFAAGIAGAKFPYNMELLDSLGSVKDFFAAIFFVTLGALVYFPTWETVVIAAVIVVVTCVVKPYIAAEGFKLIGYTDRASVLAGLSLNQVSELSLILAIQALISDMISQAVFEGVIIGGAASMIISSYAKTNEEALYQHIRGDWRVSTSFNFDDHVVVIGADIPGRRVVDTLLDNGVDDIIVVDNDAEKLSSVEGRVTTLHGDVMNDEVLDAVGAEQASLIVCTALQTGVSHHVLDTVAGPEILVYAGTTADAQSLYDDGATFVIVPDIAVSDLLKEHYEDIAKGRTDRLREAGVALLNESLEDSELLLGQGKP